MNGFSFIVLLIVSTVFVAVTGEEKNKGKKRQRLEKNYEKKGIEPATATDSSPGLPKICILKLL